jgi:2-oxoisovalerate dehydrogenase E1 component beta subunit
MPEKTIADAIHDAIRDEMARDPTVVVMGEDVGYKGGVFKITDGLQQEFGTYRAFDTPIAEVGIAGIAIGAAFSGLKPIAEMQFADYSLPAYDQIVNEAACIRYRSNGDWGCPVVFRSPFGAGVHGGLYHSQSVEALFCHTPGLKVVIPATAYDAKGLMLAAIRDPDPVMFYEHKKSYRRYKEEVPDGDYTVPIGKAKVQREGTTLSVITYGVGVHWALEAARTVEGDGISVEVLDLRTLSPLDRDAIAATTAKTGKVLILHEDNKTMGIGAEVGAFIAENCLDSLDAPIVRIGALDSHIPYSNEQETAIIPNPVIVTEAVRKLAAY